MSSEIIAAILTPVVIITVLTYFVIKDKWSK